MIIAFILSGLAVSFALGIFVGRFIEVGRGNNPYPAEDGADSSGAVGDRSTGTTHNVEELAG